MSADAAGILTCAQTAPGMRRCLLGTMFQKGSRGLGEGEPSGRPGTRMGAHRDSLSVEAAE